MIKKKKKKQLEGLGSYKNILKIEEKKGGRFPLDPSPKSAYVILFFIKHNFKENYRPKERETERRELMLSLT